MECIGTSMSREGTLKIERINYFGILELNVYYTVAWKTGAATNSIERDIERRFVEHGRR